MFIEKPALQGGCIILFVIYMGVRLYLKDYNILSISSESASLQVPKNRFSQHFLKDFYHSKQVLSQIYAHNRKTFYCSCAFEENFWVDHASCAFKPKFMSARNERIEWEHIVPAHTFGGRLSSWSEGHKNCRNRNGDFYKGRRCARKVSVQFRKMEADMHNLVPVVGSINSLRGNKAMTDLRGKGFRHLSCEIVFTQSSFEPRHEVKGFVARAYLYMHHKHPWAKILNRQSKSVMIQWHQTHSPSDWERKRSYAIAKKQGNPNIYVHSPAVHF